MSSIENANNYSVEQVVQVIEPEVLLQLSLIRLDELQRLNRAPAVIVTELDEFLAHRNPDVTVVNTGDSIGMMVDNQFKTIYSAVIHS